MKKILLLLLVSLTFYQCKKEPSKIDQDPTPLNKNFDTIKPLSYYPMYPGSFWKYLKNGMDTILYTTSQTYLAHNYLKFKGLDSSGNLVMQYTDTVYVPFLNGSPVYGYQKIVWHQPPFGDFYSTWPIISENVGYRFERDWTDKRYGDFSEKLIVASKSINANQDSIISLKGNWVYGPNVNKISTQTFIKNIGLSTYYIIDTVAMDTIYSLNLINFYINK
jgi:hypothetical protein